jgi:phosphoglycolate phosphatase
MTELPPRLKLVVFDCDGTLVDSQHSIVACMESAWRAFGLSALPTAASVRRIVGLPLVEGIALLHPDGSGADHAALADCYKQAFLALRERGPEDEPLFPGVREAVEQLNRAGVLLGIATGKGRRGLSVTLSRHGLMEFFVTRQTADDAPGKPHPGMLLQAMAETGAGPAETVMVGDTTFDMIMARNAGVSAVGAAWGYHEPEELHEAGAGAVIQSCADLLSVLPEVMERTR